MLRDIRIVFDADSSDKISSSELAEKLRAIETSPWGEWNHGRGLAPAGLGRQLRAFGIVPRNVRVGDKVAKGYLKDSFADTFSRYLRPSGA